MIALHVTIRMQPGQGYRWKQYKEASGLHERSAPGFLRRIMLGSQADPDTFFYISFWESREAAAALGKDPGFQSVLDEFTPSQFMAVPLHRDDCDLLLDEGPLEA